MRQQLPLLAVASDVVAASEGGPTMMTDRKRETGPPQDPKTMSLLLGEINLSQKGLGAAAAAMETTRGVVAMETTLACCWICCCCHWSCWKMFAAVELACACSRAARIYWFPGSSNCCTCCCCSEDGARRLYESIAMIRSPGVRTSAAIGPKRKEGGSTLLSQLRSCSLP